MKKSVKEKAEEKEITQEVLAEKLEISRGTLLTRFKDNKWKKSQLATLKELDLLPE